MPQNFADTVYSMFLNPDHQIKMSFRLSDDTVTEMDALIGGVDADSVLRLRSYGNHDKELSDVPRGTPVAVLSCETWAFCRFRGTLLETSGSNIAVQLHGQPEIKQRRDYFRLDVQMPVICKSPDDQQLTTLEGLWKTRRLSHERSDAPCTKPFNTSFKVINWDGGVDVEPSLVNLSGGGLRMNTAEAFKHGHLLELALFLPAPSVRAIFAVASVIRSTEVILATESQKTYSVAMKFVFMTEKDQERIISFIFNE